MKRHVLFLDLDGTIADSGPGIHAAMNDALAELEAAPLSKEELSAVIGPALQISGPPVLERRGISIDKLQHFIDRYRHHYISKHLPNTPLNPGMEEALLELANHWHLAVVTAKPEQQARVAIEATGLAHLFVIVVGPEPDKPQPKSELLTRAIGEIQEALGHSIDVARSWMIGDRHHDIDAGVEVGTGAVGVLWGYGNHAELTNAGAHAVVHSPAELVAFIKSQSQREDDAPDGLGHHE
jgi:phosphoglycolate phosphatase